MPKFNILKIFLCSLFFLSGCESGKVAIVCPQVREWTPEEHDRVFIAVSNLEPDSPLVGAMADYARLREDAKICGENFKHD